jgi:hypothetical protein
MLSDNRPKKSAAHLRAGPSGDLLMGTTTREACVILLVGAELPSDLRILK